MRHSKKHHAHGKHTAEDKDFERLYHTIPAGGVKPAAAPGETFAPPRKKKRVVVRVLLVLLVLAILVGGWVGGKFIYNGVKIFGWDGFMSLFTTRELKGEKEGRVNILLAGNSTDDPGHAGAALTDSIMLVSINTKDKSGYLISIPRDLYVEIPGSGYAKINEAYQDGENSGFSESGYPEGGMGLLEKIVSERLGVPIHYYALVNYTALREAVDAVGGVQVTIASSDPRGLYDPSPDYTNNNEPLVDLPNGVVSLNGTQALNLARARGHGAGSYGYGRSDFTRTEQQRKILVALKDKASGLGTLANPIKLGQLFDAMGKNVRTDLVLGEARRLYSLTSSIDSSRLKSVGLNDADGTNLLQSYHTASGQSALVPRAGVDDYTEIQTYIQQLYTTN